MNNDLILPSVRINRFLEKTRKNLTDHCLPENFYDMDFSDFLKERRKVMAKTIRGTFESL